MSNLYMGREAFKRSASISGEERNAQIDRILEAGSREIDHIRHARPGVPAYFPYTETRLFPWPQINPGRTWRLWIPGQDLIAVTTLQTKAQDSSPTTIASSDFFLEPQYYGPPYHRIEIDFSSNAAFEGGDTSQRSISVAGRWGYREDTIAAGTVRDSGGINATVTTLVVSDGALVDVGDTLLIGSEQLYVSERGAAAQENNDLLNDASVTASKAIVSITVDNGTRYNVGETILVDSERMFIETISGNVLTVIRMYDGTVLAAHANDTAVFVFRTLTVVRGANGTTAATASQADAITKLVPPADVADLCLAKAIGRYHNENSGYARTIGTGEGARAFSRSEIAALEKRVAETHGRIRVGVI